METWAAVTRVSHVGTRDEGSDTFHADDEQVEAINAYAKRHGARVEFLPAELSVSGGKPISERPSLRAAIEGVEAGQYSGIVVAYLSRLTRSRSGIEIWDRVEAAGGHVHCAQEGIDTSTVNGRMVRDLFLMLAVREREEHADRHDRRRRETVKSSVWRQRQVPRGYVFRGPVNAKGQYKGAARQLVPGPDADEVRQAFADRRSGTPISALAKRLGMTPSGVRQMLANKVYLGHLRDGQYVNETAHEPLIDIAMFEAVQTTQARPPRRQHSAPALLAGIVRCASCGHVMTRSGTAKLPAYTCPARHSREACPGPAAITMRLLDEFVEGIAREELARLRVEGSDGQVAEKARARVEEAERELSTFLLAVSAADVGPEAYGAAVRQRREQIDAAKADYRAVLAQAPALPALSSGADAWDDLNGHERNSVLRGLLGGVVVARGGGRGSRVPIEQRVRVLAAGADLGLPKRRGGTGTGISPLVIEHDDPRLLRVAQRQHAA